MIKSVLILVLWNYRSLSTTLFHLANGKTLLFERTMFLFCSLGGTGKKQRINKQTDVYRIYFNFEIKNGAIFKKKKNFVTYQNRVIFSSI